MRLWHYKLLPYLPDLQFKGQLRELVAVMHDWRDKGKTNHLLINNVMDYPKAELSAYFDIYYTEYFFRYGKHINYKYAKEFEDFAIDYNYKCLLGESIFGNWHNKEYLKICMANLYEKYKFGKGKSKITDNEWEQLIVGYKSITGEDYNV